MANEISGVDGRVVFSGASTYINTWTLNLVGDALETTNFDDSSGSRTYIPGLKGWSGSFDCFYSTGNTLVPGSTGTTIILGTSTGKTGVWKGTALITGMDVTTPRDGLVTQSYSFQGSGTLATST